MGSARSRSRRAGTPSSCAAPGGRCANQGVAYLDADGAGSAIATSCDAATAVAADVPGTFHVSKADATKGTLKGSFVGLWQNSGDLLTCKFSATRSSAADPMIDACP